MFDVVDFAFTTPMPVTEVRFFFVFPRDEDPTFFSTDPAQLKKNSGSGSGGNRNEEKNIFIF